MNWWLAIAIAATLWVAGNSIVIVMQRRPAASTIAWLLVLVFLPIFGIVVYRLIGPLRLERRKRRRSASRRIVDEGLRGLAALDARWAKHHQLALVSIGVGGEPPLLAESVEIYFDGASTYDAIFEAIAAAREHIHVEYYIWDADTIGTRFRDLLVERARAGVTVRVILDGAGCKLSRKFLRPLRDAGVKVVWFNPVRLRTLRGRRADFRSHRKIVVCDGRIGFTGGMNISDLHSAKLSKDYWRDTHLRLTGAAVWPIQRVFFEDWYYTAEELIPVTTETVPPPDHAGEHVVQIVSSGPDTTDFAIHKVFFTAINDARARIWLTTPYFVPDDALLTEDRPVDAAFWSGEGSPGSARTERVDRGRARRVREPAVGRLGEVRTAQTCGRHRGSGGGVEIQVPNSSSETGSCGWKFRCRTRARRPGPLVARVRGRSARRQRSGRGVRGCGR